LEASGVVEQPGAGEPLGESAAVVEGAGAGERVCRGVAGEDGLEMGGEALFQDGPGLGDGAGALGVKRSGGDRDARRVHAVGDRAIAR
jgi:hypothetical protein